jgi:outer membrane protein assembly factor BamB
MRAARSRLPVLFASALLLAEFASGAEPAFHDPAPSTPATLAKQAPTPKQPNPQATFHAAPKPLAKAAVIHDWAGFLGPTHNGVSTETRLLKNFPKGGPPVVWEVKKGSGYSAPAVLGERLLLFHRIEGNEVVECLHAGTGERFWQHSYPSAYVDRYGYSDGPRASPVIGGEGDTASVFTIGAEGQLHCLELSTGRVRWNRDLLAEFKLKQNFFGVGSTPLVEGDKLIVNVGAPGGPCVAAFDVATGRMAWGAGSEWGPSYASPVPAVVHGKRRVFVFAGGETGLREKPSGGLLCIDPANGKVDFSFPWRGNRHESVNASSPLVTGNRVLVSECYGAGGAMLEIAPDLTAKPAWTNDAFGTHFMTAVHKDGHLYGVDGHGPHDAFLVCVDARTGKEVWRTQPEWKEPGAMRDGRDATLGTYRSFLIPTGDGRCLCLGEFGHLLWLDLNPQGYKELGRCWLFAAKDTWTPPVLSRGLLYVCQNNPDLRTGRPPRLLCYDLRDQE